MRHYDHKVAGRVQANGTLILDVDQILSLKNASRHSITITPKLATTGTIGVKVKTPQCDELTTLLKDGADLVFDLSISSLPQTFGFEMPIDEWNIEPTGVNGTYDVVVTGWA